jgi:acyl-CoA reductase-like NAD-dependent aldehyde dehydrogenase
MTEESFGPVVGIMAVDGDEQAVKLMNDSCYGLTASIWTKDQAAAVRIGDHVETGTWFMNRCDYPGSRSRLDRGQRLGPGLHALQARF